MDDEVDSVEPIGAVGPGTTLYTKGDIGISLGGALRIIPTYESDFDFGIADETGNALWSTHLNEGGVHTTKRGETDYFRQEAKINVNVVPDNRDWSFYARLEGDGTVDTTFVDNRTGGNFGFERIHATMRVSGEHRLHWAHDIYAPDIGAAALVYGDEGPGFWLEGPVAPSFTYNVAYLQPREADRGALSGTGTDDDRRMFGGYLDYSAGGQSIRGMAYLDQMNNSTTVGSNQGATISAANGPTTSNGNILRLSTYWTGSFGPLETMLQGAWNTGSVETQAPVDLDGDGSPDEDSFDVNAFAFAGDLALKTGNFKPALGFIWTSGDSDASDSELGGFASGTSLHQFTRFGTGGTTIAGDHNPVLGTGLYSYLPQGWGNQAVGVKTGGLGNAVGGSTLFNDGRGDNPGLTLINARVTGNLTPSVRLASGLNNFWFNEDFNVNGTTVESGYMGSEWANQVTFVVSRNTFIRTEAQAFFPGEGIKDVTQALVGTETDETAFRGAAEFVWSF